MPLRFIALFMPLVAHGGSGRDDFAEPLRTGMQKPDDHAVIIGIEDYAFIPDVPYAERDAQRFYDAMVYTRGIPLQNVQHLDHLVSREKMLEAVTRAGEESGPGSVVWIYYAGHGAGSPEDGARLLLGNDTQQDPSSFAARSVPVDELKRLAGVNGARVMLITDTCYTGAGRSGEELASGGRRFMVPTYAAPSTGMTLEWVAASPGQTSGPLDDKQHGAFTYFTLSAMRGAADGELSGDRDGSVTIREMQAYVTRMLREDQNYEQTPQLLGDGDWTMVSGIDHPPAAPIKPPKRRTPKEVEPAENVVAEVEVPRATRDKQGVAFGLGVGWPTTLRFGYELGRDRTVTALGVRAGFTIGRNTSFYTGLPIVAYTDIGLADRWDLEVSGGNLGGLAVQYDPPSPFQLQLGALVLLDFWFSGVIVSPDVAAEWVW